MGKSHSRLLYFMVRLEGFVAGRKVKIDTGEVKLSRTQLP
jgi:hypothetical protein